MRLLEVEGLTVTYGRAVLALDGVTVSVGEGEAVALLGANGAGKTSLLRSAGGLLPVHSGQVRAGTIRFAGRPILDVGSAALVDAGVGQALEGRRVFAELTVGDNLRLGAFARRARTDEELARRHVLQLFPRLEERLMQRAGLLSGGEQQMLAIGRALMARPRLLLLDEPSLGLAPRVVEEIAVALQRVTVEGTSILLADQSTTLALEVASSAYLLETGRVRTSGAAKELLLTDRVRESYLGTSLGHAAVSRELAHVAHGPVR